LFSRYSYKQKREVDREVESYKQKREVDREESFNETFDKKNFLRGLAIETT
jgi:hypothetical protein